MSSFVVEVVDVIIAISPEQLRKILKITKKRRQEDQENAPHKGAERMDVFNENVEDPKSNTNTDNPGNKVTDPSPEVDRVIFAKRSKIWDEEIEPTHDSTRGCQT